MIKHFYKKLETSSKNYLSISENSHSQKNFYHQLFAHRLVYVTEKDLENTLLFCHKCLKKIP